MVTVVAVIGIVLSVLMRRSPTGGSNDPTQGGGFTQVGREGSMFTVSVPRARVSDDEYLLKVAERLSSEEIKAGGSGQVSVMVWPDDVPVPKVPPTTEFDALDEDAGGRHFHQPQAQHQASHPVPRRRNGGGAGLRRAPAETRQR